jgi:hypothetical protein
VIDMIRGRYEWSKEKKLDQLMPSRYHDMSANLARIVFDPIDNHQQKFSFHGKKEYSRVGQTTRSHVSS